MRNNKKLLFLFITVTILLCCAAVSYAEGSISGMIWNDKNADGIMDEGETGISAVTVILQRQIGEETEDVKKIRTASDGTYSFEAVEDGEYRLSVTGSNGWSFSPWGGESAVLPAVGESGCTLPFTVNNEEVSINAGMLRNNNVLGVFAFVDENENGGRRNSEELVRGVVIQLVCDINGEEYVLGSIRTNNSQSDYACFRNVTPGTYKLKAALPDNYIVGPLGEKISNFYNVFPPVDQTVVYSLDITLPVKESIGSCLGLVKSGSLSGSVYDNDDLSPLSGVEISLYSPSMDLMRSTVTDEEGTYSFIGIQGGEYELTATLPDGKMFALFDSLMTRSNTSSDTVIVKVTVGRTVQIAPICTMNAEKLSVQVQRSMTGTLDAEGNVVNIGETAPAASATVLLYSMEGELLQEKATDEEGIVCFEALLPGEKQLQIVCDDSTAAASMNTAADHGCIIRDDEMIIASAGTDSTRIVLLNTASLSGIVFADVDHNGMQDEGEEMLEGIAVTVKDASGLFTYEVVTDVNGAWAVSGLVAGEYTVMVDLGDEYIATSYSEASDNRLSSQDEHYGYTEMLTISVVETTAPVTAGLFKAATISGYVVLEGADPDDASNAIVGLTASLCDAEGNLISESIPSVSAEDGIYTLKGILPGEYRIRYTGPENYIITGADENNVLLSDVFTVKMADVLTAANVSVCVNGIMNGHVLYNGQPAKATLELRGHTANLILIAETDSEGAFTFANITPDEYDVVITLPDGYMVGSNTDPLLAEDGVMNDQLTIHVLDELNDLFVEAVLPGSINGYVFMDQLNSGDSTSPENNAAEGILVTVLKNGRAINSVRTDENGLFTFNDLIPGSYTLDIETADDTVLTGVTADQLTIEVSDNTSTSFCAGLMTYGKITGSVWNLDGSLNHVSEVSIILLQNGTGVAEAFTEEDGSFCFEKLTPGEYTLNAVLPDGYLYAASAEKTGKTSVIYTESNETLHTKLLLAMGEEITGQDIGVGAMGAIGDYAWLDDNANGLQDIGEKQVPGIRIELYQYDEFITETVTDVYGHWEIRNLYPGVYTMKVTMPAELKATTVNTKYPLINSILPESSETTVECEIVVPSGDRDLKMDLGFVCRKEGVLPESMSDLPQIDWSFNGTKEYLTE